MSEEMRTLGFDQKPRLPGRILYNSAHISARFLQAASDNVIVSFPDRVHPTDLNGKGWGEDFFARSGLSAVYVNTASKNWFQTPDFIDALVAIRAAIGSDARLVTYGSSMGGYAALLAAKTLGADRCLALAPQYDIHRDVVPFETRYQDHADEIGPFIHNLKAHVSQNCAYHVAYDPTHGNDAKHVDLLNQSFDLKRVLCHGAGHGILSHWIETGVQKELAPFLIGGLDVAGFRNAIRVGRVRSPKYLRRMANKAAKAGHGGLVDYMGLARRQSFFKSADKIGATAFKACSTHRRVIIHAGIPKTGTSSVQAHFFQHSDKYAESGLWYPKKDVSRSNLNHAWMSEGLRETDTSQLEQVLGSMPPHCHTLLLSDESLYVELPGMSDAAKNALKELLKGWQVELLLFDRDPDAWKRSFYIQSIQNRRAGPLRDNPTARNLWQTALLGEEFFELPYVRELLDVSVMKKRLISVLGADTVRVLQYSKTNDTIDLLCDAIDIERVRDIDPLTQNGSLSDVDAEVQRQANKMSGGSGWFIKALREGKFENISHSRREKQYLRAAKQAQKFPWDKLEFVENPPLKLTKTAFNTRLAELRKQADVSFSQKRPMA